jgi:hypothetical protein
MRVDSKNIPDIISVLDERGERESKLKAALEGRNSLNNE